MTTDAALAADPRRAARRLALTVSTVLLAGAALWLAQRPAAPDGPVVQDLELPAAPDAAAPAATGPGAQFAATAQAALTPLESAVDVIVARNDTLDSIFRRLQLSVTDLAAIRQLPGVRQSLDLLRPGDVISMTHLNGEVVSLTRRVSDTETLTVARTGPGPGAFESKVVENALETTVVPVHGRIRSSLFKAINDAGASDAVALQLAEVFRYDVDFAQELQPGDTFALVLEKVWRDGEFLRDGEILAAEFTNGGTTYRAIRYTTPDGRSEYYTPDGRSLRKAFLRAPLQFTRISSGFGLRRHPVLNTMRAHKGVDYAAPVGTPIRAAGDGRITFRGTKGGYGHTIVLAHAGGVETLYAHMHRFAKGVFVGKRVKQGELIGYVGMSGLATGPHLHYEYRVNGVHRDPSKIRMAPVEPIPAKHRADFDATAKRLLAQLDAAKADVALAAR